MRTPTGWLLGLLGLLGLLTAPAGASDAGRLSESEAREEVRIVVENVIRHHPNPFHVTEKDVFDREVEALLAREGEVSVAEQFFDLSRLMSLVFDTHTQLHVTEETDAFLSTFPLRFRIFPGGLYIIAGSEAYRDAIGARVTSIGGQDTADVLDRLSFYSPSDNRPRKRVFAEMFFYLPEMYDVLGLETPQGTVELGLEDASGNLSVLVLSETWDRSLDDFGWDTLNPFIPEGLLTVHDALGTDVPFYLQRVEENYWYEFLDEEEKFMYIQINRQSRGDGDVDVMDFHFGWSQALWSAKARTKVLIVDVRNDPGGDINLGSPISGIISRMAFDMPALEAVVVLLGTDTVSAGTILAAQLERVVAAVLIGSPTGSAPNMFLSVHGDVLPHSNIEFEVSQQEYISVREADARAYMAPDIPLELSFDDFAHGRDPLLEKAKEMNGDAIAEFYGGAEFFHSRASQEAALR